MDVRNGRKRQEKPNYCLTIYCIFGMLKRTRPEIPWGDSWPLIKNANHRRLSTMTKSVSTTTNHTNQILMCQRLSSAANQLTRLMQETPYLKSLNEPMTG